MLHKRSDYFRQNKIISTNFSADNGWVILSSIEEKIKSKIEKIGTPLKDWDINIYRGILTGYNEAFIITKKVRDRLVEDDPKSDEIIRPILRGRDIEKYKANWAGLYLIATFPSMKYDIEKYPAVKEHLLTFGYDRLKQTGDNGSRKKTNNKWFETQDSISYWEDFFKQKIVYPETMRVHKNNLNNFPRFAFDEQGIFCDKTVFFIRGNDLKYLFAYLNSKVFRFLLPKYVSAWDESGFMLQKIFLEKIPIILPNEKIKEIIEQNVNNLILNKNSKKVDDFACKIDENLYKLLDLSEAEITVLDDFFLPDD